MPLLFGAGYLVNQDLARLVSEFEGEFLESVDDELSDFEHHECGKATQLTFHVQVNNLKKAVSEMGNPFQLVSPELVTLDNHTVLDDRVLQSYRNLRKIEEKRNSKILFEKFLFTKQYQLVILSSKINLHCFLLLL
eukprot:Pompholyxophrys_punicea_v1_NODE_142_length_3244_cov_9.803700.p2 type:complete len:136 gc:universal NODE_142_length_3244_cov_9.803700:2170-2577(+)